MGLVVKLFNSILNTAILHDSLVWLLVLHRFAHRYHFIYVTCISKLSNPVRSILYNTLFFCLVYQWSASTQHSLFKFYSRFQLFLFNLIHRHQNREGRGGDGLPNTSSLPFPFSTPCLAITKDIPKFVWRHI